MTAASTSSRLPHYGVLRRSRYQFPAPLQRRAHAACAGGDPFSSVNWLIAINEEVEEPVTLDKVRTLKKVREPFKKAVTLQRCRFLPHLALSGER